MSGAAITAGLALLGFVVVLLTLVPSVLPTSVVADPWRRRARLTLAGATAWTIVFLATSIAVLPEAAGDTSTTTPEAAAASTTTTVGTTTTTSSSTTSTPTSTSTSSTTTAPPTTTTSPAAVGYPPGAEVATVVAVTDGDTIDVRVGGTVERVRLIGINAPESGECWAAEATAALRGLIDGRELGMTVDVSNRDRFGRLLRYLWLPDGTFVNEALVEAGAALAREYPPDTAFASVLAAAQGRAEAAGAGLWAADACGPATSTGLGFSGAVFDAPGDDLDPVTGERVAITNGGTTAVDLTGWGLADESASNRYQFPNGFTLAAGATVTVYSACGTDTEAFLYWCSQGSAIWNNTGDTAFLRDPNGNVVDSTGPFGAPPMAGG